MSLFFPVLFVSAIIFLILTARAKPSYTFALALLAFLVSFFPIVWGTTISFFDFSPSSIQFVGLKNLSSAFSDPGLFLSIKITAMWALLVLILKLVISYTLALSILSLKKFSKFLYMVVLTPWAIPAYISVIVWTALISGYGGKSLLSSLLRMNFDLSSNIPAAFFWTAFVSIWLGVPMMTMVILSSMQTIPPSLKDLSKMEGLDPYEKAMNLYLPHTLPIAFPYIFISFLGSFKEFTVFFLMTNGGPSMTSGFGEKSIVGATTSVGVFIYNEFYSTRNYGIVAAYSTIVGIVMLVLIAIGWNYRFHRRKNLLIVSTIVAHAFFDLWGVGSGTFGIVPILFYGVSLAFFSKRSRNFKKFFAIGASIDLIYMFLEMGEYGIKSVSLSAIISLIVALTLSFEGKIHVSLFKIPDSFWKSAKIAWLSFWSTTVFLPLWSVLFMAFSKENIIPIDSLFPVNITLANFSNIFCSYGFLNALKNTLIISAIAISTVFLTVFPATWAAVDSKKAISLGNVIVFASFFSGMHTLIPLAITFNFLGLMNTLFGIGIAVAAHSAAISYFLLYPFLSSIPKNLNEAAKLDGANGFARMTRIYLPIAVPSITTVGVFVLMESWNSFVFPLVFLSSQHLYPVSMMLYNLIGEYGTSYSQWNTFGAGAILNIMIVGTFFFISRKHITSGVISKGGI